MFFFCMKIENKCHSILFYSILKINITVTGSHVECHTYSKWPRSNNKMHIAYLHLKL